MDHTVQFGGQEFLLEDPLETEYGLTPPRLIFKKPEQGVSLYGLSRYAAQIERELGRLKTDCLWCISPGGFELNLDNIDTIPSNTHPNWNTTIHTHVGRDLDITFTKEPDCTRLPLEFFTNEKVWTFIRGNKALIEEFYRTTHEPECFYPDTDRTFMETRRRYHVTKSFLSQTSWDFDKLAENEPRDINLYLSAFFSVLPFVGGGLAKQLSEKANTLKPDCLVPWNLAQAPSGAIFRGFHRGGIQEMDSKASILNAPLRSRHY